MRTISFAYTKDNILALGVFQSQTHSGRRTPPWDQRPEWRYGTRPNGAMADSEPYPSKTPITGAHDPNSLSCCKY